VEIMKVAFAPARPPATGTWVVLVASDGTLGPTGVELDRRTGGGLTRAVAGWGGNLKRGEAIELRYPSGLEVERLVLLSLGKPEDASRFDLESVGASLAVRLKGLRVREASVVVEPVGGLKASAPELAVSLATGACLRAYRFDKYRTAKDAEEDQADELAHLTLHLAEPAAAEAAWQAAEAVIAGVTHGRDLVTEPANVLSPEAFAEACRALGSELGMEVEVLDRADLQRLGMNALLAVGQGSARESRVATLRWSGGAPDVPPVALLGKGVCFDSGGLSLKPPAGMEEMKWDMAGAAAVFGAMKALAGRKARANVVGVLGLTENMPSGTAQRPGDVVTSMSGLTIEVANTDAEGRLVLADVLHYAKEHFKPKVMIDLATLTGAIIVALGHEQAGLFTLDDELAQRLQAAGAAVGERLWRMPLGDDYAKHIKSDIADLKNVGRERQAGATAGAVFLQRFAGDVPWAHIDIAGTAWSKEDRALAPKGATGYGIRLLERLIADHYET
jgi:leucyl aminopeptidase